VGGKCRGPAAQAGAAGFCIEFVLQFILTSLPGKENHANHQCAII
jgi:hypothetical protein